MFTRVVWIAASALLLSHATAVGQSRTDEWITQDVRVRFSDLDVDTAAGAHSLLARLKTAAGDACGGKPFFDSRYRLMPDAVRGAFTVCREQALSRAVSSLAIPLLTVAYADSIHAPPIREAAR